jgi:hypothetical protein
MLDTRGPTGAQSAVPEATSLHANLSMTFALRVKAPPNYSVYTAAAASAILGTISNSELTYYEIYIQNKQLRTDSSETHTGHRYVPARRAKSAGAFRRLRIPRHDELVHATITHRCSNNIWSTSGFKVLTCRSCMGSPANTARLLHASNGTTEGMSHWVDSSIITRSNIPEDQSSRLHATRNENSVTFFRGSACRRIISCGFLPFVGLKLLEGRTSHIKLAIPQS